MNARHRRTLAAVFADAVSATIEWTALERLLLAIGCIAIESGGSRVKFERDGLIAGFHRPHPAKEAKRYQVRDAREYMTKLGVRP